MNDRWYLINTEKRIIDEIDGDYQYAYNYFRQRYNINNFEIISMNNYEEIK